LRSRCDGDHKNALFIVIANLMAMPVVSAWVMPAGILGLISMPLGFDGLW
jgi:competence protein ComEC